MPSTPRIHLPVAFLPLSALACGGLPEEDDGSAGQPPDAPQARPAGGSNPDTGKAAPAGRAPATPSGAQQSGSQASSDNYFVGQWRLVRYGAPAYTEQNGKQYLETPTHAAAGMSLQVNGDGSWAWADSAGSPLAGSWRPVTTQEDPNFGGQNGIVVVRGQEGTDWVLSYTGVEAGVDNIRVVGDMGNYYGVRVGASKGQPAWAREQFQQGSAVDVQVLAGGDWCPATITDIYKAPDGLPYYSTEWQCPGDMSANTGKFPPTRVRLR